MASYRAKWRRMRFMTAGYANKENFKEAKVLGIKAVGLPNKRGMIIEDMTGSEWI
jgi:hypothetical protein